ncbi:MAG: hypothetical protein M4579_004089 [Chaenotheca gracillima]|nr:MAG: hypothetical protein M4579_004089 [Chaenotheca gracillima]
MVFLKAYLAFAVLGFAPAALANFAITEEACQTKFGSTSLKHVPSHTRAVTFTFEKIKRVVKTPVRTITPPPKTFTGHTTVVDTVTITNPQSTDSVTTTDLETTTASVTTSVIVTAYSTTTTTSTSSPTTTIAATASYVPIDPAARQQTITAIPLAIRGRQPKSKPKPKPNGPVFTLKNGRPHCEQTRYPAAVECRKAVETFKTKTIVETARKTRTVTHAPSIVHVTSTAHETVTSTYVPIDASTTITETSTITATTTIVSESTTLLTVTQTDSVTAPEATEFAVCSPQNVYSGPPGSGVSTIRFGNSGAGQAFEGGATSAVDCCIACAQNTACEASFFASGQCFLVTTPAGAVCTTSNLPFTFETDPGLPNDFGFTISDGYCGTAQPYN